MQESEPTRPEPLIASPARGRLFIGLAMAGAGILGGIIGAIVAPRAQSEGKKVIPSIVQVVRPQQPALNPADIVDSMCPTLVSIVVGSADRTSDRPLGTGEPAGGAVAAGFFVSSDGKVLTSAAALPANRPLFVVTSDGRRLSATRGLVDVVSGLALLKIQGGDFPMLQFAEAAASRIGTSGQLVAASSGSGCTAAQTAISADFLTEGGSQRADIQLQSESEAILPGTPFITLDGRVAGVAEPAGENRATDMAMPGVLAGRLTSDLLRGSVGSTSAFGFVAADVNPTLAARLGDGRLRGAVIAIVAPDTPTDKAGLEAGDVVVSANGAPISNASELARAADGAGTEMPLQILRRSETVTLTIVRSATVESAGSGAH